MRCSYNIRIDGIDKGDSKTEYSIIRGMADMELKENSMILAHDRFYSLDTHETQLNNNVLVVGTSGSGKTRSIVIPNLLMATGSYVVSDPKGNLYNKYKRYLEKKGYEVKKLDFTDPKHSIHYNFFNYMNGPQDIVKVAHMLIYQYSPAARTVDPFWDEAAQLLMQAVMAYLIEVYEPGERNLHNVLKIVAACQVDEDCSSSETATDILFRQLEKANPDSYAVSMYNKFRIAAGKTLKSILISVNARLGLYDTPDINKMMSFDDTDITSLGRKKTALFVVVSDTDRSLDGLVNIFYAQAMNELCRYADKQCRDQRLPVPIRFVLDDFATNCTIAEFPRMISSFRSRDISTMLMIQAESQLAQCYGYDAKTIIGNCDTYVYLGGNDVETAHAVAERCDIPVKKILNMPVGTNWIFRRGEEPYNGRNFDLTGFYNELQARQMCQEGR